MFQHTSFNKELTSNQAHVCVVFLFVSCLRVGIHNRAAKIQATSHDNLVTINLKTVLHTFQVSNWEKKHGMFS